MGSASYIVDISSDEEDSYDWISELLGRSHGELEGSGDVVVVDELSAPAVAQRRGALRDDPDDDCLVLDADPDKPVRIIDDKCGGGHGSDDLLIVGEKGQLACRDYPHPRHLCANFPFSTTPHEKHCNQCHCYVCDSPAPCNYWSNVVPSADHCHSTDKDGKWEALRKSFKQGKNMVAPPPQRPPDTLLSMMPPLQNPVSVRHHNPVPLPTPSSKSSTLWPCPGTSVASRTPISQRHHPHPAVIAYPGQRLSQNPTGSEPLVSGTQYVQREKRGAGALAAQIMQSHAKFRRVETTGCGLISNIMSQSQHGVSSQNQAYRDALQRSQYPPVTSLENRMETWQNILMGVAAELGVSDNSNRSSTSVQPQAVPSQPPAFSQHLSQTNASQSGDIYAHSAPLITNSSSLGFDCGWLDNNTTAQDIAEHGGAENSQAAFQPPPNLSVSGENHLESVFSSVEQELPLLEAGKEIGLSELDPAMLLYDFDNPWSSIA